MLNFLIGLANVLMVLTSLFLICLVLIQRGKGGGLAGAFGGVGGSSAFGTKAGDVFTRVTIYVASFWFLLALFLVYTSNTGTATAFQKGLGAETTTTTGTEATGTEAADKDKDKATSDGPSAGKGPSDLPPRSAPASTPQPLNPGGEGAKETTNLPATPPTPKTP